MARSGGKAWDHTVVVSARVETKKDSIHVGSEISEAATIQSNGVERTQAKWFRILAATASFSAVDGARSRPCRGTGSAAARTSISGGVPRGAARAVTGTFRRAVAGARGGGAAPTGAAAGAMGAARDGTRSAAIATMGGAKAVGAADGCPGAAAGAMGAARDGTRSAAVGTRGTADHAAGRAARPTTDVDLCSVRFAASNADGISSMAVHLPFSFQDLLSGVTSGAVAVPTVHQENWMQESMDTRGQSECIGESNGVASSSEEKSAGDSVDEGYMQSGGDDSNNSSEEETTNGSHETNEDEAEADSLQNGLITIPSAKDMKLIDWYRFYTTGELVKKTNVAVGENNTTETMNNENVIAPVTTVNCNNMAPQGDQPGWKKVEMAMRKYCEKKEGHVFEPHIGITFDSEAEAFEFYNLYSWEVGFGVRKGSIERNTGDGYQTMREIVCHRQGFDKRTKAKTKGCNCRAMIRLHRTDDDGWFISKVVKEHNHELSATDAEKREWGSHSKIDQTVRDMIKYLRENNITLSMDSIPFTRRSLRTICAQIAREQRDDDIRKTLELFRKMRAEDPGFQFSVDLDEKDQIKTLIWASGRSRSNYSCFADVVTFDTTYSTNLYKMPFGLFVGVNNHFQSSIFAGVLTRDEKAESFKRVFKEFLALMGGVQPQTILTDQCKAMEIAINAIMPGITHLWCKWHVFKDARIELGPLYRKNAAFQDELHKAYDKRKKWAKAYNKGKFCARMRSTQRSESANHMLKTVVPRNSSMNRFVENLNKLLYTMYTEEEKAEHDTKQEVHIKKRMWPIERHALQIYTSKVYDLSCEEIDKSKSYDSRRTEEPGGRPGRSSPGGRCSPAARRLLLVVDDHLGSAAGRAAAPFALVIHVHLDLAVEWNSATHLLAQWLARHPWVSTANDPLYFPQQHAWTDGDGNLPGRLPLEIPMAWQAQRPFMEAPRDHS
ncbi:hypothetical protein C2845_PM11G02770 [Panicum miliaceum]|uniref:Protein FAR1-RELATED SEQUENCE n=1 Tax=Panicum miliaceum TaxID=4540 RepID=A0A3L6RVD8_PANMI|nr:hypothetical protein C2845_PM11G02770 [Panicum miliaceum]